MDLAPTQLRLFNTGHAWGRKVLTEKNTFEGHGPDLHVST